MLLLLLRSGDDKLLILSANPTLGTAQKGIFQSMTPRRIGLIVVNLRLLMLGFSPMSRTSDRKNRLDRLN